MFHQRNTRKRRRGFGLVETVICIVIAIIIGASAFAGGAAVIKKAQNRRTSSDLHNFAIALETFLNETPKVANCTKGGYFAEFIVAINKNLPTDYQFNETRIKSDTSTEAIKGSGGNITINGTLADADGTHVAVYESIKTDAWGNHYYLILDDGERHGQDNSEFYITVISAGSDAKTQLAGKIGGDVNANKIDDVFLLVQYMNGDVSSFIYVTSSDKLNYCSILASGTLANITAGEGVYSDTFGNNAIHMCPVNF